ncbi:TauD/TfdA family dioxygenase, partial [Rhodococcus triatomae]
GDLVLWDNTGMLHRAVPYAPTSPRLLHRTTLAAGRLARTVPVEIHATRVES